ncbi:hypothetical protein HRbin06_00747 [archaeon HR06]|nr:hypothetical protein HRbin06_00747 [archaeon HR06]
MGLIFNLDSKPLKAGDITSPFLATIVSLVIQILPASTFVGILKALNSLNTGPGGNPVFPAGIIISSVAISPAFAATFTLFFSINKYKVKTSKFVNIKALEPFNSFKNSSGKLLKAFLAKVFLATTISNLSFSFLLNSTNCEVLTL